MQRTSDSSFKEQLYKADLKTFGLWDCPNCGYTNDEEDDECLECGEER